MRKITKNTKNINGKKPEMVEKVIAHLIKKVAITDKKKVDV